MNNLRRIKSNRYQSAHVKGRLNLIFVLTLLASLSGILLYFTNSRQIERIQASYCGDFGFSGKSLVLMKDGSFRFSYYGCSQSSGFVRGQWAQKQKYMTFEPVSSDEILDSKYYIKGDSLLPVNLENEKFVLCESYIDPFERALKTAKSGS